MIREQIWQALEPAVTEARHSQAGAAGALSDRDFLEAVPYLNRVGCPWRDLPAELGYWHAVYMRFRRWEKRGAWQRLCKNLQTERFAQARAIHGFDHHTNASAAAGAPKKTAPIRLWDALAEVGARESMRRRSMKTAVPPST